MESKRSNLLPPTTHTVCLGNFGLSVHPGPALVLTRSGSVVATNGKAELLVAAFKAGRLPNFPKLLLEAGGSTVIESLSAPSGATSILELVGLPTEDGNILVLGRDVTLERNLRAALVESRQRYKDLVEISSDFAWEVGPDGRFVFVSPKGALGFAADELVGHPPSDFIVGQGDAARTGVFAATVEVEEDEVWMRRSDGEQACLLASATPIMGENGVWRGARGVCRDITLERMRDAALARANNRERLLSYIVRTIRDEVDPADMLRAAAEATARALGASACQIFRLQSDNGMLTLAAQFGHAGDATAVLADFEEAEHFDGESGGWHVLATVSRYRHAVNGAVVLWREPERAGWGDDDRLLIDDVAIQVGLANEQIGNHERILRLSRTDSLTGLFNRRAFFEEIARRFHRLSRDGRPAALIYVDLDNFKWVNDVHGHQTGDQALLAVRDLLQKQTRPTDLVARLGGDEFAIWLEGAGEDIAIRRCQELLAVGQSLESFSGSSERPLHMSLGVAVHTPGARETMEELIARADQAMYEVKRGGKGDWRLAPPLRRE